MDAMEVDEQRHERARRNPRLMLMLLLNQIMPMQIRRQRRLDNLFEQRRRQVMVRKTQIIRRPDATKMIPRMRKNVRKKSENIRDRS